MQQKRQQWRADIRPLEKSRLKSSIWQMVNTLIPFFALWYAAYLCLSVSWWLSLVWIIPASGFLIRTFIIFHDCCHGSFFKSKKANAVVGTVTGILTCVPFHQWKYTHSVHHATSSNLDKRGVGDVWTMTVDEYEEASAFKRLVYRVYRNPFVMFGFGPIYIFLIDYRFNRLRAGWRERLNTYLTNVGIAGSAALLCWLIGWQSFLLVQGPIFLLSGMAGIWLFYVQHQFEHTYFEHEEDWDYVLAAMQGSSFYKLPKVLQWLTGNIGYHHIHHLSPRVPNYYLERAHNSNPALQRVQTIGLRLSLKSLQYKLWNERSKQFEGFRKVKLAKRVAVSPVSPVSPVRQRS